MRLIRYIFLSVGAVAVAAETTQAADVASGGPYSWTGAYIGLVGAYMSGSDNWSGSVIDHGDQEFDAITAGLKVGAGMTLGSILYLGAEVDGAAALGDYDELLPVGSGYDAELNYVASARLRAGIVFERTLIYGTVGGAVMNLDRTFFRPNGEKDHINESAYGTTYGVGIEFGLSDHLRVFGEYRVTDYSDLEETSIWAPSVETNELSTNTMNVGLNYSF